MQIVIDNITICADGYIPIPEEKTIQFYRNKNVLEYIPPVKVDADVLSDFGKELLYGADN